MQTTVTAKPAVVATGKAASAPVAPVVGVSATTANHRITLLVPANPKVPNRKAWARFNLYQNGQTVAAYQAAVVASGQPFKIAAADLLWDQRHGFISLTPAQAPKAAK